MLKKSFDSTIIRLVAAVALLATFLVAAHAVSAQDDGTIDHLENGPDPVATFTAEDPEGKSYQWMALSGTDAALFTFDDGVLSFREPPDFEAPKDMLGTDPSTAVAADNVYEVTVAAIDDDGNRQTKDVMVKVTNKEEDGKVTLDEMPPPYPGIELTATLGDDDGGVSSEEWQWSRSMTMDGTYTAIEDAEAATYTPTDKDVGYYLRATVAYDDAEGDGKSAKDETDHAVQPIRAPNTAPVFPDGSDEREVAEGGADRNVGAPVGASDNDGDVLTHELGAVGDGETCANNDNACFAIDAATGQIKTKAELNHTGDTGQTDPTGKDTYTVTVRAIDSGRASTTVEVTITVTEVDEPPTIAGEAATGNAVTKADADAEAYSLAENFDAEDEVATFTATDPEGGEETLGALRGADSALFAFDTTNGELSFKKSPDYEMPGDADGDNVYEVTVVATDANGNSGTQDVKVTVTNVDELGTVTLMPASAVAQPRVGIELTASLEDPDGGAFGITWSWNGDGEVTDEATYTPVAADVTNNTTLTATATYTDAEDVSDATKTANASAATAVVRDTRNKAPEFMDEDEDTAGAQAKRKVDEDTVADAADDADTDDAADNVGDPVSATDTQADGTAATLTYTLSGPDAAMFRVRQDDSDTADVNEGGQIEVAGDTKLDFEAGDTYMVTVVATDSFGVSSSIEVTITPIDVNEGPTITGTADPDHLENSPDPVATFTAEDPEGKSYQWMALSGTDAALFTFDDGVLSFIEAPDFEAPKDMLGTDPSMAVAEDNVYEVTVAAIDDDGNRQTKDVMVKVTNKEEDGKVTLDEMPPPYPGIELTATLGDDDGTVSGAEWQWSRSMTMNGTYTAIEDAEAATYTPTDKDVGYYLRATVAYDDAEGDGKSAKDETDHAVQPIRAPNTAPVFPDGSDEREVAEGGADRNVGAPVGASDNDGDVLTHELGAVGDGETCANNDNACFAIDAATGQIKTKAELNHTGDTGQTDPTGKDTYTVTVRAIDSGRASTTVEVTITVTEVDEPPTIAGEAATGNAVTKADADAEAYSLAENFDAEDEVATFTATDPEGGEETLGALRGADSALFAFDTTNGELSFKKSPDYEMPGDADGDNVYEVTVVATDANSNSGTQDVKVTVTNVDELGTVTLMPASAVAQPRVGIELTASLEDPDGGAFGITWSWNGDGEVTDEATYTPVAADVTNRGNTTLTATATYTDAEDVSDATKTANASAATAVIRDTRNKAPEFMDEDEDTAGVQAKRKVDEDTVADADDDADTDDAADNVGDPVSATDTKADGTPSTLTYTLSGPDAAMFRVRQDDSDTADVNEGGQIEVAGDTKLDFEAGDTYMVTVVATDSFGISSSIEVTITPIDVNEGPTITEGGLVISGTSSRDYAEDETEAVATYTASGPESATARWSLSGDDAGDFRINSGGMLTFRSSPDHENPTDADEDNVYEVTVEAADGTYDDTHTVTVTVTNVEEAFSAMAYDTDGDGMEIDEVGQAIFDFFAPGSTLTAQQVEEVILLYLLP